MNTVDRTKLTVKRMLVPADRRVACNFCNIGFIKHEPDHSEKNPCPLCGSVSRERVVYSCLLHEVGDPTGTVAGNPRLKDLRLIEFSPRNYDERADIYNQTFKEYVATDFDLSAHTGDMQLDITKDEDVEPLAGRFDVAIFAHVLEHIPDYEKAIQGLKKIMAPGGLVIVQVPILEPQYTKVTWDEFHGDNTKVYHRFGFDLAEQFAKEFDPRIYVGLQEFPITSTEIHPQKYQYLNRGSVPVKELSAPLMRRYGLGSPDLCEAFVLRA